jgi:hypothetical protein
MDVFQDLFSDRTLFMIQRRLCNDFHIRNKNLIHPIVIKKELIGMSDVIYNIICTSDRYAYPDMIEKIVQTFLDNYAMKHKLVFPKFKPVKLETPYDYHKMDAYNEYKSVYTDGSRMSHETPEYKAIRRYRLERHVDKDPLDGMPSAREWGYGNNRKMANYAYTDDKVPDFEWELNANDSLDCTWSKEPKEREVITDYSMYYKQGL